MREIKFRGIRVDNGEWVYGNLLETKPKHGYECCIIPSGCFSTNGLEQVVMEMPMVYPATVGQYTGLKDKNGVEIYEGDEVVYIGVFYTIRWSIKTSSWFLEAKSYDKDDLWFHKPLTSVVITGNVHESKP